MQVGLIGTGNWGKHLARNFYDMGVLGALCDLRPEALFSDIPYYQDATILFQNEDITQIAIATPPSTHYLLAKEALLAGKDVFVEKPLCFFVNEIKELIKLANQKRKILMVGHLLHYHPCISLLKETLRLGKLGEILSIQATRTTPHQSNTAVLWDLGAHDVSLLLSFFDYPLTNITCEGTNNDCRLTLTFSTSLQAQIFLSTGQNRKEQKLVIVGSKSTAIFEANQVLTLKPGKSFHFNKEPLRQECDYFFNCCRTRKAPLTDGKEALRVIEVLQKAEEKMCFSLR